MSAESTPYAPVRLLVAEASENSAHAFDSMLRDAGISTRLRLTDLSHAGEAIPTADVMLCNARLPHLEQLLPQLRLKAPHVPIILVNNPDEAISTSHGLRLGAADVVSANDPDELVLVFKRELDHVCRGRRMSELHRALEEAEQRCKLLLQNASAAIAYVHEGMHIYANEGYLELFGFDGADELMGLPLMDLLSDDSAEIVKQELKGFREHGEERTLEITGRSRSGEPVVGTLALASAEYEGEACLQVSVRASAPGGSAGVAAAASAPVSEVSATGAATTAPGAVKFLEAAESILASSHPYRAVMLAQMDGFSKLQEELGLCAAEAIGTQVCEAIQGSLGQQLCARLSAHQFAFAITESDRNTLLEKVEALRAGVEAMIPEFRGRSSRVTLSIGGAELDDDQHATAAELLETALDTAFLTAQRAEGAGGNRVQVLTKEVARQEPDSEAGQILARINEAIDNKRFLLLFQPIISLRGDCDEHYEVFLRMLDADGGQTSPNDFLRTAIENGVAAKIDRWVILQSIKALSIHRASGHNTRLTINLSANSVADPQLLQWLGVAMKAARLPSDAVIFQITERDAADQLRQTRRFVEGLRLMHCRSSLSRFGLATSPMNVLRHIPVDFVKLDGSLVKGITEQPAMKEQVTRTIRDLQANGKLTIVPMVENASMLSALWQAGANYIQGHYLQEPTPEMNFDFSTED